MVKPLETCFKRVETKYAVSKTELEDLMKDLKEYLVEDDYPTSTISNIYFDTEDFDVIQDSMNDKYCSEKIRMRTYLSQPKADSQVFLEIKSKDEEGIGHKSRLYSTPDVITKLITQGEVDSSITDQSLVAEIEKLRKRYSNALKPRMYIYYDRFSMKEKKSIKGFPFHKIRVTIDQNLTYRDEGVTLFNGNQGEALLDQEMVIMEIKAPGQKPQWLQDILNKHGLVEQKFSKYSCAYHKSQGMTYAPRPVTESRGVAYV